MTTSQVAADLRAAAEVLRRDGWTQGNYFGAGASCCAEGAIFRGATSTTGASACISTMVRRLRMSLIRWNDAPGRTADEVIAALEAAADAAERAA